MPTRALPIALALAQASRHPLSRSIANALVAKGIAPARLDGVREVAGDGVFATQASEAVALRRPQTDAAQMAVELVIGDECWPVRFDDRLRTDAGKAIDRLHAMGIDSRILSGDRSAPLAKVADELGLESLGNVSPQEKLAQLEQLKAAGTRPLMVGDGLNDGPALAAAHASIAPGTASDASQQAADAVFIGERLMPVADAVTVARRTMRVVRQNFGFAIAYNMLAIPLALAGAVTPLIAAIAMSLSSLVVIGNSLRLAGAAK